MNVSRNEAVEALDVIARSRDYIQTLRGYTRFAPFLLMWGAVWVIANTICDLAPMWAGRAWLITCIAGTVGSIVWGIHIGRRARALDDSRTRPALRAQRAVMLGIGVCCYFPAMYVVLGPLSARQENAFISLFWAFAYMFLGAWVGWRLFTIGAIAAAAVVYGYLAVDQHYYLWMAACGGGTLIAGGLWLRKI